MSIIHETQFAFSNFSGSNEVELAQELDKLTNDAEYIKKIAQEKFHMVKPGEKVFRVIDRRKTN